MASSSCLLCLAAFGVLSIILSNLLIACQVTLRAEVEHKSAAAPSDSSSFPILLSVLLLERGLPPDMAAFNCFNHTRFHTPAPPPPGRWEISFEEIMWLFLHPTNHLLWHFHSVHEQ